MTILGLERIDTREMFVFTWSVFLQGLGLGAGLIIAIGAQNAFVLKQGLKRSHVFATASICTICDVVLIALGVGGLGAFIAHVPVLTAIATWGGAAFLLFYGLRSFRAAITPGSLHTDPSAMSSPRLRDTVATVLALSLLNPHVYLDTVVLVGSIGAHYAGYEKISFALGAMCASFLWFFGLAYGATRLAALFQRPLLWRVLDCLVGCIMWLVAGSLIWTGLHF